MTRKPEPESDAARRETDEDPNHHKDDDTRMREANENIRKSQGDDAGHRPTIDRHR